MDCLHDVRRAERGDKGVQPAHADQQAVEGADHGTHGNRNQNGEQASGCVAHFPVDRGRDHTGDRRGKLHHGARGQIILAADDDKGQTGGDERGALHGQDDLDKVVINRCAVFQNAGADDALRGQHQQHATQKNQQTELICAGRALFRKLIHKRRLLPARVC